MPITALDGLVILITLLSAFLAMVRGFSREVLSLASWALAALIDYYLFQSVLPFTETHISNKTVALAVTVLAIFLIALLVISILTMKLADIIIDSRIGALDRILGFVFGVIRGVLILAVSILFINKLMQPEQRPEWINDAKSKPLLDNIADSIYTYLPQKMIKYFNDGISSDQENTDSDDASGQLPDISETP